MDFTVEYIDGIFICAASGRAGEGDAARVMEAMLSHPEWKPGTPRCYDVSGLDSGSLTIDEMRRIASFAAIHKDQLGGGKIAMVASRDLEYGFSRMLSVLATQFGKSDLEVFRTREEALAWLSS
ncbi:MAG: hypothetical protein MIO92_14620 [Methanosarcinaceae archaeon]|nr:hypothetical protein [Methanosarcinaceae archaeon]